ncbi:hypothetical protein QFZ33_001250 [Arthrobacter globiformis]|nr:hypothetical protein [Arthrobacter globiformis]
MLTRFPGGLAAVLFSKVVQKCAVQTRNGAGNNGYGVGLPPLTFRVSPTTKLDSAEARNT